MVDRAYADADAPPAKRVKTEGEGSGMGAKMDAKQIEQIVLEVCKNHQQWLAPSVMTAARFGPDVCLLCWRGAVPSSCAGRCFARAAAWSRVLFARGERAPYRVLFVV